MYEIKIVEKSENILEEIFKEILNKLKGINFACIGTMNLYLQGIDIRPNDIDFVTDNENLERIAKVFKTKINNDRKFNEFELNINGREVHFASCEGNPLRNDDFKNPIWVKKWGLNIPCMLLKSDLEFYQKANRIKDRDKIKLIKERLILK